MSGMDIFTNLVMLVIVGGLILGGATFWQTWKEGVAKQDQERIARQKQQGPQR